MACFATNGEMTVRRDIRTAAHLKTVLNNWAGGHAMIGIRSLAVIAGIVLGTIGMSLEGIAFSQAPPACNSPTGPFCNAVVPPPAGWPGRVFVLNQTYPATAPADSQPWLAFDPTNH